MLRWRSSGGFLIAAALALAPVRPGAAEGPLVAMDLPASGPLAISARACYDRLKEAGLDVWWLREREPQQADREPGALLFNTNAPLAAEQADALPQFVQGGGGVVLVAEGASEGLEDTRRLLAPFGVKVYAGAAEAQAVQLRSHPVTAGVSDLGLVRADLTFSATGLDVLVSQGARPIAVAGTLGEGRFVVLLDNLVSLMADALTDSGPMRLLTQSVNWVLAKEADSNPIRRPDELGLSLPAEDTSPGASAPVKLSGTALTELSGEGDRWPDIRHVVEGLLDASGLKWEPLGYEAGKHTLAEALVSPPDLLVLGAVRPYEEDEQAAFGQYIWNGGSALILAYCTPRTVAQLQALNRLLATVNLATTFGRPAGTATVVPGPLTSGLNGWKGAPSGVSVWGLSEGKLLTINGSAAVVRHVFGQGRVIACDATLLLPPAKAQATDGSQVVRDLLARSLGWLVSGTTDSP